jgi:HPt (histidine-containing phosphotransfer) domain-containing protein
MTRASLSGHTINHALLVSADPAWGRASGLESMLHRLGFAVCTNSAAVAELQSIRLVLLDCSSGQPGAIAMPGGVSLPVASLRFAVAPADAAVLPVAAGLHGVLPTPPDECTLILALAAHRYVAIAASERHALGAKLNELACGDGTVALHLIRLLIDTNDLTLATLRDAFRTLSWEEVAGAAHRIAGSACMLDCSGMVALLARLETAAREREFALAGAILQVVADTIGSLDASLRELLDASVPS